MPATLARWTNTGIQDFDGLGVKAACAGTGEVLGVQPLHNGRVNSANANSPASISPPGPPPKIITGSTGLKHANGSSVDGVGTRRE